MVACASCGAENAAGSRFCNDCGAPFVVVQASLGEERKVVSALFCDLVGFTADSDGADPEDVDRMLTSYFALARREIEAHGGVVEKFIGDAVLGVFGVPAAHEDDPERAVRAALRIVEGADGLRGVGGDPIRLRIGINTGEVLVRSGVAPESGEHFLAGDAINTASRIQSVAPELGVAVGLTTYEATAAVFDYTELPPATVKGKTEPVRLFQPKAPRARLGVEVIRTSAGPYIGREIDLSLLRSLFDKSVTSESAQLVTVVGEPGIGKSRIVAELLVHAQAKVPGLTWRQGRCLPYGDGVTFWALGEIVKAEAGILESDDPATAGHKIEEAVPVGPDGDWMRQRLLPLVGLDASSSAEREELFAAWRGFLETVAERSPTVLVFEDIHWADEAMLAFLEYLADRAQGVPLFIVATARPELFERHAAFAAGLPNVNRVNLGPLSDDETARLVGELLGSVVPAELQTPLLERAEGNPLYAEEFVRLLRDRDLLEKTAAHGVVLRSGAEVPLPESIAAIIAARLDTLTAERKQMLADAAVVGKVFWAGAVAAMGERDVADVTMAMRELARKELIRPARRSSMIGETEYAFWHVLTRDVAYAQLPRASRAGRHVSAARWLESKAGGERVEDIAEVLAHHYATALDLARTSGQADWATALEEPALRYLTLAGDKVVNLDVATATATFARALALTPPGNEQRPALLVRFAKAVSDAGRPSDGVAAADEAAADFRARGDQEATVDALGVLTGCMFQTADPRRSAVEAERLALADSMPPSPAVVRALIGCGIEAAVTGRNEAALGLIDRAMEMGETLGLERSYRALGFKGMARCGLWDNGGLDDIREAIDLAMADGDASDAVLFENNLAANLVPFEGPAAALRVLRDAIDFAQTRGFDGLVNTLSGSTVLCLVIAGAFDEALSMIAGLADRLTTTESRLVLAELGGYRVQILTVRGQAGTVTDSLDWIEATVRAAALPEYAAAGLAATAGARAALGQDGAAGALLAEIADDPATRGTMTYAPALPELVRTALAIGDEPLARRLVDGVEPRYAFAEHALVTVEGALAEACGDLADAAAAHADATGRWERFGVVPEQAFARLGQGRCLVRLARLDEAAPVLRDARELFARLGAAPALAETDALLAEVRASRRRRGPTVAVDEDPARPQ